MILEFKLIQNYNDSEGDKTDVLKFAFEDTVNAKDISIEFIKHGSKDRHDIIFIDNNDIDELIWFLQSIKSKNTNS